MEKSLYIVISSCIIFAFGIVMLLKFTINAVRGYNVERNTSSNGN